MDIATQVNVANSLLAALPRKECLHLMDELEQVVVTYGVVLYEPGQPITDLYFPIDSLISLLAVTALTHKRWLYWVALVPTVGGVVMGLAGLLGWHIHPDTVVGWLT